MAPATSRTVVRAPTRSSRHRTNTSRNALMPAMTPTCPARDDMKGRSIHPMKSMSWYNDVKKRFAALPER